MTELELREQREGVVVKVRARAAARENAIQGIHDGALRVSVTPAPEKGKANKAIIATLAKCLQLKRSQLVLLAGATSPHKEFLIAGLTADELRRRVATLGKA